MCKVCKAAIVGGSQPGGQPQGQRALTDGAALLDLVHQDLDCLLGGDGWVIDPVSCRLCGGAEGARGERGCLGAGGPGGSPTGGGGRPKLQHPAGNRAGSNGEAAVQHAGPCTPCRGPAAGRLLGSARTCRGRGGRRRRVLLLLPQDVVAHAPYVLGLQLPEQAQERGGLLPQHFGGAALGSSGAARVRCQTARVWVGRGGRAR